MINFAHRGASIDYPENTMKAFKEAIFQGGDGIELDVHKTKDNKLVVIHDEDVARTFLGKGLICDYTLEELSKLKCRRNLFYHNKDTAIPTLEEVIELVSIHNIKLNIELKTDKIHYKNIEEDVINLINKYKVKDKIIISSFNKDSLKICRELDKTLELVYLVSNSLDGAFDFMDTYSIRIIHPNLKLVTSEFIIKCKNSNKLINVYTVDSPKYMRWLINKGVHGIITNTPLLLKEIYSQG